ncbi:12017_t:CDS:2 [Cetraspora pellucida]|uniref:12017_t:CDS:1 n=1 Tax=Cetraspora pellucida TaxID=1433469 RepID=A0ACA9LID2_9GLOM|nr:12017_t:CDS:2 [Cetraspora pellucida]
MKSLVVVILNKYILLDQAALEIKMVAVMVTVVVAVVVTVIVTQNQIIILQVLTIKDAIDYVVALWNKMDESTIVNCWNKTGILPLVVNYDVELAQNIYLETIKYKKSKMHELVIDLTDLVVLQKMNAYKEINNTYIPIEETFDDNQIVETVLVEQLECEQGDLDDSNEEPSKISLYEGLNVLKTFILFSEQMDNNFFFNNNDLAVF